MSRSIKKNAVYSGKDTLTKKKFNRSLRRKANQAVLLEDEGCWFNFDGDGCDYWYCQEYLSYEIGNGKEYRKHNCSYDIQDYKSVWWSKREYVDYQPIWFCFTGDRFNDSGKWYKELMK